MVTIACLGMTMFHPGVVFRHYAEKGCMSSLRHQCDGKEQNVNDGLDEP